MRGGTALLDLGRMCNYHNVLSDRKKEGKCSINSKKDSVKYNGFYDSMIDYICSLIYIIQFL